MFGLLLALGMTTAHIADPICSDRQSECCKSKHVEGELDATSFRLRRRSSRHVLAHQAMRLNDFKRLLRPPGAAAGVLSCAHSSSGQLNRNGFGGPLLT